jgi:hypothetical protein
MIPAEIQFDMNRGWRFRCCGAEALHIAALGLPVEKIGGEVVSDIFPSHHPGKAQVERLEECRFSSFVIADNDVDVFVELNLEPSAEAFEVLDFRFFDIHRALRDGGKYGVFTDGERVLVVLFVRQLAKQSVLIVVSI